MSGTIDEHRLGDLLARDEIRALPLRYAAAVESRDVDAMTELFSPRAQFGDFGEGADGLRALMADSLGDSLFAVILVANHLIDVHDDMHATGQVWAHCYAQTRSDGFLDQLIRYDDTYAKVDGRWLFAHRRHRLWYGVVHDRSPLTQPPANWPRSQIGVGDIPLADPEFNAWWSSQQ
ncbi:nuclear transport factor 2 family protein [Mycobacterium sp. 236(2023)]|uniref:nuclear transport factor 2 family protein n=1 Tax=Mycobacterium sp. 236(2023) TaxID=3038163 RepID=UPI0024155D3B|nr:nuclear transport factor 2 family protein [Mycobacterium sp. 236(2023)]MDG4669144.1 nuclear transport factor 2 family protein [Mycobacterium sp. 236(2023)]